MLQNVKATFHPSFQLVNIFSIYYVTFVPDVTLFSMYAKAFSIVDSSNSIKPLFRRDLFKVINHSTSILPKSYGHLDPGGLPRVLLGVESSFPGL